MTESDETEGSDASTLEPVSAQPAESSSDGQGLEAAPTDNGWLQDMESVRGSAGRGDEHYRIELA